MSFVDLRWIFRFATCNHGTWLRFFSVHEEKSSGKPHLRRQQVPTITYVKHLFSPRRSLGNHILHNWRIVTIAVKKSTIGHHLNKNIFFCRLVNLRRRQHHHPYSALRCFRAHRFQSISRNWVAYFTVRWSLQENIMTFWGRTETGDSWETFPWFA